MILVDANQSFCLPVFVSSNTRMNILTTSFLENPYPTYEGLRNAGPIHWSNEFFGGAWLVTRHRDVAEVLQSRRYSARRTGGWVTAGSLEDKLELCPFQKLFGRAMLFLDSPDHCRLRRVLNHAMKGAVSRVSREFVEAIVQGLIEGIGTTRQFDFVSEIATPLPALVIARMLGIENFREPRLKDWSANLSAFIGSPEPDLDLRRRAQTSLLEMYGFFKEVIGSRRTFGCDDDLVSSLITAEVRGELASEPELVTQCAMMLFAGYETTRNLLGNGMRALLANPPEWNALLAYPELIPGAVRELLRYDSPVQYTGRRVTTDHMFRGQKLQRGQLVIALIGSANRDPERYTAPDRLDIRRREGSNLSFGRGPHVCIGASLTQLEAEVTFRAIARRWPDMRLSESSGSQKPQRRLPWA